MGTPERPAPRPLHVCVLSWPKQPPITADELIRALILGKRKG